MPNNQTRYCSLPKANSREFSSSISTVRMEAILVSDKKWTNGTTLKYYFFKEDTFHTKNYHSNGTYSKVLWKAKLTEKRAVVNAFKKWKDLGIGLNFEETTDRLNAHFRIGFADGEGAWSYIGRDCWSISKDLRTMNFGWNILNDEDTILHEIGHALGLPHEHQNPYAGIEWNEEAVYNELAGPPNNWSRNKTFNNILRKIDPDTVQGSSWDPDSIMHYPFNAGMISSPLQFQSGITPEAGLSQRDITWIKKFYPKIDKRKHLELKAFHSEVFDIEAGDQVNFEFSPKETRNYTIQTFGKMDTVMVLSEDVNGEYLYISGDDDSGENTNSNIKVKLHTGRKYIINLRLYYKTTSGETCLMAW